MKKLLYLIVLTFLSSGLFSQDIFEKGYYINNSLDTNRVLIKNEDWKDNPNKIYFKNSLNSEEKILMINEFVEFEIKDRLKFVKYKVLIDRSSDNIDELSTNLNPEFNEEELLLKVLIEGGASLFSYEERNLSRFFFKTESGNIEQLVFKRYKNPNQVLATNNYFRQQLLKDLNCSTLEKGNYQTLKYTKKSLTSLFVKYNICKNYDFINFSTKSNKGGLNFYVAAGIRRSQLSISNVVSPLQDNAFEPKIEYSLGILFEYVLPFRNGDWSVFLEPTFHNYSNTNVLEYKVLENDTINVNFKSIELPFGLKYNFVNNNAIKFYSSAFVMPDIQTNSEITFSRGNFLEPRSFIGFGLGLGVTFKNKLQMEVSYYTPRNILAKYTRWNSKYKTIAVRIRYNLVSTYNNRYQTTLP